MLRPIALLALIAVAACDQPFAPPASSARPEIPVASSRDESPGTVTKVNDFIAVADTVPDPCTGEPIAYEGILHIVSTLTQTPDSVTLKYHLNAQSFSGVGMVTGAKYGLSETMKENADLVFATGEETGDFATTFRLVSQGGLDNFALDVVYTFSLPTMQVTYKTNSTRCGG